MKSLTALVAPLLIATSLVAAPQAAAEYDIGCEFSFWGFLGSQRRTICDGPRRPDGSWQRGRIIDVPAHTEPSRTTCSGTYSVTCYSYQGGFVPRREIEKVFYDVTDDTIPPGEPGWLPEGAWVGNAT